MKVIEYVSGDSLLGNSAKLGVVRLFVKNLAAQVSFYNLVLKLTVIEQGEDFALLGDKNLKPLLYLKKEEGFKRYQTTSGLYHFALLYPSERELAKAIAWLMELKYQNYPTDHGFSKTTYLKDFEGNDIELYIRTPERAQYVITNGEYKVRYKDGRLTDGRDHLNLHELYQSVEEGDALDSPLENMEMGHVHLYGFNDLDAMQDFYTNVLGFAGGVYMPYFRMSDVGLTKETYHVIAFNGWKNTSTPAPRDALGLDYYTIEINDEAKYNAMLERIKAANVTLNEVNGEVFILDPSSIKVKLSLVV